MTMAAPTVNAAATQDDITQCARCHSSIRIVGDIVSDEKDLSHVQEDAGFPTKTPPICEDCMNLELENLKAEIAAANNELSMFTEALFELEQDRRSGAKIDDESEGRFLRISEREKDLLHELQQLQSEEASLQAEMKDLLLQSDRLTAEERKLQDSIVSLTRTIVDSDESMEAVNRKLQYCQSSLRRLKRMNLIEEAFDVHVSESGFALINGLRLGQPGVPWSEVNAGLGFLCLLLDVLVKRANISLSQYRLLPRGSYSVIIKKSDKSVLELFADDTSGGISRFLTGRKFDAALTAFVQIVGEVVVCLEREDRGFAVPYPIDESDGKIGGLSATLQFNSDETWSTAIKMLCADMRMLTTYIDSRFVV
jgi:beclin 1